jgi:putative ABC transport system permease protein
MGQLLQDLRFALRVMGRRPLPTVAIVTTLALGIGANAAIFRVVSAAFLRPLPFADEGRLVRVYTTPETGGSHISPRMPVFLGLRDHARCFASVVAQRFMDMTLDTEGGPERVTGIAVSSGWARALGIEPLIGRAFLPDEERRGLGSGVALASHAVWQERYGGDPGIVGRTIRLDGQSRTIVGVMPAGLRYPYQASFWIPMVPADDEHAVWGLNIQARLRPDASLGAMRQELERLSRTLPAMVELQGMTLLGVPLREDLVGDQSRLLVALLAAVGFLMLIVSVNVAHLLLASALSRGREFAIRTALGAGFLRQFRQLAAEGCVLALLGGAFGLVLAWAATSILTVLLPPTLALVVGGLPYDHRVIAFGVALSLVAGLAFGALPALQVARREPREVLRGGERASAGTMRFGGALIVSELALALVLLSGAGALLADVERRERLDLGYQAEGLLTLNVAFATGRYLEPERRLTFLDQALDRLQAVPGVESAGALSLFPADGQGTYLANVEVEGRAPTPERLFLAHTRLVTGAPFDAMRMRLLRGRAIGAADRAGSPEVAMISRSLAAHFWGPGEDPVGKRIRSTRTGPDAPWLTVVGVVDDVHEFYAGTAAALYLPFAQHAGDRSAGQAVFVVRAIASPEALVPRLRRAIWDVDPGMAVFDVATASALYADSLAPRASAGVLTLLFAGVGLLVAAMGVYGAVAFAVSRRTREIAIRMAIGAERSRVLRGLLMQTGRLVLVGLALGAGGAAALAHWMASVTEVEALDPRLVLGSGLVLAVVAVAACYLPARKAASLDPATALRSD